MPDSLDANELLKGLFLGSAVLSERYRSKTDPHLFGNIQLLLAGIRSSFNMRVYDDGEPYSEIGDTAHGNAHISYRPDESLVSDRYGFHPHGNVLIEQIIGLLDYLSSDIRVPVQSYLEDLVREDANGLKKRDLIGRIRGKYKGFLLGDSNWTLLDDYLIYLELLEIEHPIRLKIVNEHQTLALIALVLLFQSFTAEDDDEYYLLNQSAHMAVIGAYSQISARPDSAEVIRRLEVENAVITHKFNKMLKGSAAGRIKSGSNRGEKKDADRADLIFQAVQVLQVSPALDKGEVGSQIYDSGLSPYDALSTTQQYLKGVPHLYREAVGKVGSDDLDKITEYIVSKKIG